MVDPQRQARIELLKQQIREATGENPVFGSISDCPPEVEEAFLRNVLAYEVAPKKLLRDTLRDSGVVVPNPEELRDEDLSGKLWEVIHGLLALGVSIDNTDHLSDRELYTLLYTDTLDDELVIGFERGMHIDMTEYADYEESLRTYLKYYASEKERRDYAKSFPDLDIPARCEPPKRRDHLIP